MNRSPERSARTGVVSVGVIECPDAECEASGVCPAEPECCSAGGLITAQPDAASATAATRPSTREGRIPTGYVAGGGAPYPPRRS